MKGRDPGNNGVHKLDPSALCVAAKEVLEGINVTKMERRGHAGMEAKHCIHNK